MSERSYTLFLLDGSNAASAFEFDYFPDIDAARRMALKILADRPRYLAVEISDGLTAITVEREQATKGPRPAGAEELTGWPNASRAGFLGETDLNAP